MRILFKTLLAVVLTVLACKDVWADVPPIPTGQDLTAQAERFRQEYSVERRSREQNISKALVQTEEYEKKAATPGVSFVLNAVHLNGTTIFPSAKLSFIWKPYLGKQVNFTDLHNIVKLIKRVYKDLGYLTTTAYLPPQDIKEGQVEIYVVEGKLGRLRVEGNKYFSTGSIEHYFHTYPGETLDMGEVEKDVMRINNHRDLEVSSVLSPGENPETVDVTLKTQENFPYHVTVGTDNQGSRLTGRFRRLVGLSDTNVTGHQDTLSFNGAYTDLSQGDYLSYQTPVGTNGTKLGMDAGYFQGKLGEEFKPFDVTTYSEFYNPNASFELYESENSQADLRSGIQIKHINKKQAQTLITDEDLRLPYVAMDMIRTDATGQTTFSPELSFSMPGFLGGSKIDNDFSSRPKVDGFYTKFNQYIIRTQNMPWGSYAKMSFEFQAANRSLPTSEQLQLGGDGSVRGYPQGDYLADVGGDLDSEWYFPAYVVPEEWQWYGTRVRNDIEPFGFFDMGGGKLLRAYNGERGTRFLAGLGGGVRIQLRKNFYLKLEWAIPVGDKPVRGTGPSTFDISLQMGE